MLSALSRSPVTSALPEQTCPFRGHPLAKGRSIDQGILPEKATDARAPFDQPADTVVRDEADFHRRRRGEVHWKNLSWSS